MIINEVFLSKEDVIYAFDRRDKRLYCLENGQRIEVKDSDDIGNIVTSTASVLSTDQIDAFNRKISIIESSTI